MSRKPIILVFVGPNGSGKSSLAAEYQVFSCFPKPYLCPDEMVKRKRYKEILDVNDRYKKAKKDLQVLREMHLLWNKKFTFETVGTDPEKIAFLKRAKALGYYIEVVFVTTRDPEINIERIKKRVAKGGHDVKEDDVRRRYGLCMELLPAYIEVADVINVYDNSEENFEGSEYQPLIVFSKDHQDIYYSLNYDLQPAWVNEYIEKPLKAKGILIQKLTQKDTNLFDGEISFSF
ncbi:MAG: hypothetical protein HPY50_15460 [Firmicutes bacterium]|nr:hypothetical protein [Bacillota bacterium]